MRVDEQQHPDYYSDRKAFYALKSGSMQAADDAAIAAYIAAHEAGKSEAEMHAAFFDTYNNART